MPTDRDPVRCAQEFDTLLRTLMGERNLPEGVIQDLWEEADGLTHGAIDAPTLSRLLTEKRQHKGFRLMTVCPITGRALRPDDDFGNIVYMTLALDGGLSSNLQGGYRTAAQARPPSSCSGAVFYNCRSIDSS